MDGLENIWSLYDLVLFAAVLDLTNIELDCRVPDSVYSILTPYKHVNKETEVKVY